MKIPTRVLKQVALVLALTIAALSLGLYTLRASAQTGNVFYVIDGAAQGVGSTLSATAGGGAATDTIPSAGGGNFITTPNNPLVYTVTGINGTYNSGQTQFSLYLDSLAAVGNGIAARISYDFTGDGTYDRVEVYNYFATDPVTGYELYNQTRGQASATGTFANLVNGRVRLEVWSAIGNNTAQVRTSATSGNGQQSSVTIPYNVGSAPTSTRTNTAVAGPTNTPTRTATRTNTPTGPTATFTRTPTVSGPTLTFTRTPTATITNTQPPAGNVVPLYSSSTSLEPATVVDTGTALITRFNDRARDRHAREANFHIYDHYLSHYWEHRTAAIEVVDRVAKGGTDITFNVTTQWKLSQPEFRAFFRGINTVAEYHHNALMTQVSGPDANGITNYTITVNYNAKEGRNIQIGDRMEIEISQFLDAPPTGRANYYGTTVLYMVGQGGMVPWEGQGALLDSFPLPQSAWQGGRVTLPYQYSNEPLHRFKQMAPNTAPQNGQPFMLGRRLFHTNFSTGAHSELSGENGIFSAQIGKLGPRFYTTTCDACHANDGGTLPPGTGVGLNTMVVKVGNASGGADPNLGTSLQPSITSGGAEGTVTISSWTLTNGTYGDGSSYQLRKPNYSFSGTVPTNFSVRRTQNLIGIGLLEALAESTISALADPNDSNGDGISGRMQTVTDPVTGQTRMGRFGWKAGQASVAQQVAAALNGDMGVTTSIFPNPDCGSAQSGCGSSGTELNNTDLDHLRRYVSLLGVAARRNLNDSQVQQGETLFASANCTACHKPTLTTSQYHPFTELRSQTIHPYTDMLLHDMGTGLADNLPEGAASGAEWRTAPLWSAGLTAGVNGGEAYLHDGRARNIAEAILWHGGEANAAKEAFRTMSAANRAALIAFILAQ
jgi:CxxC motif-containing protein (DUF1111 family)